jgi:ATP synthase F1 gamma subunit
MRSVGNTERITNAMKLVAASKLKHATARYAFVKNDLKEVSDQVYAAITKPDAPEVYRQEREGKTLYITITGSKGLCGGYNAAIIKMAQYIKESGEDACFLTLGTKIKDYCVHHDCELCMIEDRQGNGLLDVFDEAVDEWKYSQFQEIARQVMEKYRKGEITKVVVLYTKYVNTIVQRVRRKQLFPLVADPEVRVNADENRYIEYEPNGPELFDFFVEENLALLMYRYVAEATLCEHSARRMAMKNASDNAKEMLTELSVYYNRARQATITNELIEIVAGAEALKKFK